VLGQNQPGPATTKNQRGELFSPHPPASRTNVLHAGGDTDNKINEGEEEFTWRGGGDALLVVLRRWRCCGGGRWLQAAALLFQAAERESLLLPLSSSFFFLSLFRLPVVPLVFSVLFCFCF
jgi:hypothetical protein